METKQVVRQIRLKQNDIERVNDKMRIGEITYEQAIIELILIQRVRVVINSIPKEIRAILNNAVKKGVIGRFKKEGKRPECFFNPTFEHLAVEELNKIERAKINTLKSFSGLFR